MTSKVHASCLLMRFPQVNKQFTHGKLTFKMLTLDHLVQMHSTTWLTNRYEYKCSIIQCPYEANCQKNITDPCFIDETTACNLKQQEQYLQHF